VTGEFASLARTRKGVATIELSNGNIRLAELHWYDAHGIGKREIRRKRFLDLF
jgi:hypothetical protein